jgi:hypothetical protein
MTWAGLYGDSGSDNPAYYLALAEPELEALVKDEATYRKACTSRQALKFVAQAVVGTSAFFQSTAVGLDNRQLLPPFFPVLRASDATFGETVRLTHEHSLTAFLPLAVRHEPPELRHDAPDAIWRWADALSFQQVHSLVLGAFAAPAGALAPADRLARLGQHFRAVGQLPLADFRELLAGAALRWLAKLWQLFEHKLHERKGQPHHWAQDLGRAMELARGALLEGHLRPPPELRPGRTDDEAFTLARTLFLHYGELLLAWPHLMNAAGTLAAQGRGLTRAVTSDGNLAAKEESTRW